MRTLHDSTYHRMHHRGLAMTVARSWDERPQERQWHALCEELFCRGEVLKQGVYKAIVHTQVNGRDLLVKRYTAGGPARRLKYMFSGTRARQEFLAADHILQAGIPTPAPLLLAERRACGCVPGESLIALEFVPECRELRDAFFDPHLCTPAERLHIAARFGEMSARIFRAGINQQDYSLNNFLVRKHSSGHDILFIDFERVSITEPLTDDQALRLLAKLNRVGREVSDSERLCFISEFARARGISAMSAEATARAVQDLTVEQIKKDIARGRITSLYTHGRYERINHSGAAGLRLKNISPDDLAGLPGTASANNQHELRCENETMRVMRLSAQDAEKLWACLSALIIAGLDAELPQVLITQPPQGCVLYAPEALERCKAALAGDTPNMCFLRARLPEAFNFVRQHIA